MPRAGLGDIVIFHETQWQVRGALRSASVVDQMRPRLLESFNGTAGYIEFVPTRSRSFKTVSEREITNA
jgi:hypothetical protein